MFRHYRVILRQPVINTLPSYTSILYNEPTNAHNFSQIITLLHVSTLSRHPQTACNQHLAKLHQYVYAVLVVQFTISQILFDKDDTIVSKHVAV